jgi:hypothetical protein
MMSEQLRLLTLPPMVTRPVKLVVAWSPDLDALAKKDPKLRDKVNGLFEALFEGETRPAGWVVEQASGGEPEVWVSHDPDLYVTRVDHPYLTDGSGTCAWCRRAEHRNGVCAMVAAMLLREMARR